MKKLWPWLTKLNINASFVGSLIIYRITIPPVWLLIKKCSKKAHYACACQSKPLLATMADPHVPQELHPSATSVIINKIQLSALLDSCSTDSYISDRVARELKLEIHPSNKSIILAQKTLNIISRGNIVVNLLLCLNSQLLPVLVSWRIYVLMWYLARIFYASIIK